MILQAIEVSQIFNFSAIQVSSILHLSAIQVLRILILHANKLLRILLYQNLPKNLKKKISAYSQTLMTLFCVFRSENLTPSGSFRSSSTPTEYNNQSFTFPGKPERYGNLTYDIPDEKVKEPNMYIDRRDVHLADEMASKM